jgi:hypothetical protein
MIFNDADDATRRTVYGWMDGSTTLFVFIHEEEKQRQPLQYHTITPHDPHIQTKPNQTKPSIL